MCADGQITWNGLIYRKDYDKIMKYNGCLYGFSGTLTDCEVMRCLIKGEPLNPQSLDCYALMLTPEQKVYMITWVEGVGLVYEKTSNPTSIGSGMAVALGAIKAGASAREAVRIACDSEVNSGGKIRCKKL